MQGEVNYHRLGLTYNEYQQLGKDISFQNMGVYHILAQLGQGCFAKVYQGMNKTNHQVAIKVLDLHQIQQEQSQHKKKIMIKLSKTEDKIMTKCSNPNIVKCHDVYLNQDLKIIVMQYCNGGTLQEYLNKRRRIPQKEAILIIKQILNGIAELHSHKIVHRDLKCANIFVHNSQFKIGDFGFSKELFIDDDQDIGKNTILGTLSTMAPQILVKKPYGLKADIWSVGIIFYQLLFGELPYFGFSKVGLINDIKNNKLSDFGRLSKNGVTLSPECLNFLNATLEVDQHRRIGWKELVDHPLFRKQPKRISTIFDVQLKHKEEKEFSISQESEELEPYFPDALVILKKIRNQADRCQIRLNEQEKSFKKLKDNLQNCLKVELVYNHIISKINEFQMLSIGQRKVIELMYLLTCRCYYDIQQMRMSFRQQKKQKIQKRVDPAAEQTKQIVAVLYDKLLDFWKFYYNDVTKQEHNFLNKVRDYFILSKTDSKQKNKFILGIQDIDFQRKQQILYTQSHYITPLLQQLNDQKYPNTGKLLKNYTKIMLSESSDYPYGGFEKFIEEIIQN